MPKFFVVSDIHGFYDIFIDALDKAGFDKNNEDHYLICCGDYFDRGKQPHEVMNFLMSLPRKILIRGNHEILFKELCERGYPCAHDYYNGTVSTLLELGDAGKGYTFDESIHIAKAKTKLFYNSMINYFETENYIFVHSWIPTKPDKRDYGFTRLFKEDWREATDEEWKQAMWNNPFQMFSQGLNPTKTIVFGHYHCSTGWAYTEGVSEFGDDAIFDPFISTNFIAIDACTAHSKKVNIIVIEDNFLNNENDVVLD